MAVYVMVIYALTNSARFPRTFEGPVNFALLTVLNSLEYMVFPLLIGALCALPFTRSDKAQPATRAIMLPLAAAGTLAFAMPLLPWPSLIFFLKGNVVYECMSSLFTPYLMGALIVSAFHIPKKARRFINT